MDRFGVEVMDNRLWSVRARLGEIDILLGSYYLSAARSWSVFCPLLNRRQPSHPYVNWFYCHLSQARERIWKDNSWVEFYYANVLRSIYEDLLNITPKWEKTPYNVSSRWLEILSEFFRNGIPIIMTAELMISTQALSNWFQYPAHADNIRMRFVNVLEE